MGGQMGPLQGLRRVGQAGLAAGGVGASATQAAFSGLSSGAKRVVGHLAELYQQRQERLVREQAYDQWVKQSMQPGTPSTAAPDSPGPAPNTPVGQPVMMDVPPLIPSVGTSTWSKTSTCQKSTQECWYKITYNKCKDRTHKTKWPRGSKALTQETGTTIIFTRRTFTSLKRE